jgi:hypothetical protein
MSAAEWKRIQEEFHSSIRSFDMSKVGSCDWDEFSNYRVTPLSTVADDVWVIPTEWVPFHLQTQSARTIDFTRALPASSDFSGHLIIRHAKRIALLDRFQTLRHAGRSLPAPAPATWVKRTQQFLRAASYSMENFPQTSMSEPCEREPSFFGHLSREQIQELKVACPTWANALIARYNALHDAQLLHDWPASDVALYKPKSKVGSKASQPFSDEAFSEILRAALWLNEIQDDVLQAFEETKDIDITAEGRRRSAEVQAYRRECVQTWESDKLKVGASFPYWLNLVGRRMKTARHESWPLQTVLGLKNLLARCQSANAIILLAVTGMRIGELLALTQEALGDRAGSAYISGSQFKNVDDPYGRAREWPLPDLAARAFEAQVRLSQAISDGSNLWAFFSGERLGKLVPGIDHGILNFGRSIGLIEGPSLAELDGDITPHRFRFSVARYVALTQEGASQVLFDVLGHQDMEVTMGYALRDPEIHVEVNRIRDEVKAIRSTKIFEDAEKLGGPAANLVQRTKADLLVKSGRYELETDDILEAASILGDAEVVREGILCTAQPLERGACSSNLGLRDHAACTPECLHRLETAAYVQDRKLKVEYILDQMERAELGMREFLLNQLLSNFVGAPVLLSDFADDARLIEVCRSIDAQTLAVLPQDLQAKLASIGDLS